jgi:hypothetical protein
MLRDNIIVNIQMMKTSLKKSLLQPFQKLKLRQAAAPPWHLQLPKPEHRQRIASVLPLQRYVFLFLQHKCLIKKRSKGVSISHALSDGILL